jgi:hypothetical protein
MKYTDSHCAECDIFYYYAGCRYAECRGFKVQCLKSVKVTYVNDGKHVLESTIKTFFSSSLTLRKIKLERLSMACYFSG